MSVSGKEYTLLIKIAGAIDKTFGTSLTTAQKDLNKLSTNIDGEFVKLDKGFDKITSVGTKCFKTIARTAAIAIPAVATATTAVAKSVMQAGSDFESAFAGVKKTVDATEEEFAKLRQDVIDMSTEIPSTAEEIAGVMEIAGQLGIANDSLTEFTKTMINLGVSTNMTAADASTALARFANITSMADYGADGVSNWERLGATIVDLGNNFATTEAEIVEMSYKLASTGHIVGLTEPQILALSTAMSSVGIKTEAGGSAMSKILKKMQLAVETSSDSLKNYANVAGMTTEEFANAFRTDAATALTAFISGLNDTERNGKTAVALLDEMGLKEIRLSNMLLALANSSDIMTAAIDTANEAWNENIALAEEARKRYETVESQTQILKNSLHETGVTIYDDIREPAVKVLQLVTDKVQKFTSYVSGPDGITKWISNIGNALPTLQRKVKKYGGAVLDFFNPLLSIGKWFLKNPKVIVSAITGIGAALASYKIASTISHIATALTSMTGIGAIIISIVSALGALAGIYTSVKIKEQNLIDDNLVDHFGNIKLSLQDIQDIAEYIISADSLGGVKNALDAFSDLEGFYSAINNAVAELDKMNWKVSIGMQLTADEQESYKQAIADYVSNAEAYALQAGYAVSINIQMAGLGDKTVGNVNAFYMDQYQQLQELGKQLNSAVTDAFNDGLLEIDEISVITDLQKKMADINEKLAVGEYEASLALMKGKYSGSQLTADSFQDLQEELNKQSSVAVAAYEESYKKNYAAIVASYEGGYLTDSEYKAAISKLNADLANKTSGVEVRAIQFQLDTIASSYEQELSAYDDVIRNAATVFNNITANPYLDEMQFSGSWVSFIEQIMKSKETDSTSQKAVEQLLANIPLSDLRAMLDTPGLSKSMRQSITNAISDSNRLLGFAARTNWLGKNQGSFNGLSYNASELIAREGLVSGDSSGLFNKFINSLNREAGLYDLASPSKNASKLLNQTEQLMGMSGRFDNVNLGGTTENNTNITYNPTLQFYGSTAPNKQDVDDAMNTAFDKFEKMMDQYNRRNRRIALD